MVEFVFWLTVYLLVYTYILYPLVIATMNIFISNPVEKDDTLRSVTLIVSAYNEERDIERKIENTLVLDYPKELLEIVVVSDGSTDKTDEIVRRYKSRGVDLLRVEGRKGKTAAQNHAAERATGDILLFSDATSIYEPDVIRKMVRQFADPSVGCVSGRLVFQKRSDSPFGGEKNTSEKYDQLVKKIESDVHSIYGVNGCLYAVRKELYEPLPPYLTSDFVVPLKILEKGGRVVFEPGAVCYEEPCETAQGEFQRKIRTSRAGITGMFFMRHMLNPFNSFWSSFGLINHKIIRWLSPFLLVFAFILNLCCLGEGPLYGLTLAAQLALYFLTLLGYINERHTRKIKLFTIPFNFILINAASFLGFIQFLRGNFSEAWETNRGL